ncbi:response regulator [Iamia sp. SCSIO 61187]|uniref:hybrid sensor histidine kinase/response regulator n=1 Tax=Iamia sp. SCSIO 61187 TaxID=2722752 RepID=UPI001C626E81|nr:ATP-binding protein [Iamia sp. SCSIO 61187]QYG92716.1 response regulator [Iamia sp. SCSIO 61187]
MGDPFERTATATLGGPSAGSADGDATVARRGGVTPLKALLYTAILATAVGGALVGAGQPLAIAEIALVVLAALAATAWSLAARHQVGRTRAALVVLAVGSGLWSVGRLAGAVQGAARGRVEPSLTLDDVGVLAAAIALLLAVLLLVQGPTRRLTQLRALIEGLMVGGCSLFVAWDPVFAGTYEVADGATAVARTVLVLQPLVQLAIVAVLVSASTRVPPERWDWWVPVASGIGLIVAADVATAHGDALVGGHGAALGLVGHLGGFGVVLVAAVTSTAPPPSTPRPLRSRPVLTWLPSVAALGILATLLVADGVDPTRQLIALLVLGLSVALHLVVILESDELSGDLSQAHDAAIQASISKSRFLATVSHEIRTPMNAVIGLTGLLLDSELDEEQRELAVGVAISGEGLLDLINDLLDFSKIEAQKLDLEEIDLDLEDLIGEVAMIVADGGHRKGLEVIAYCEPGLDPRRKGDPLRLRQILLNLASNAVKFTDEGHVVIRAVPAGADPDVIAFEVVDTGVGIPEDSRTRLFEPFSQADETTTRNYGGTGLGLAIVKNLIDLQGGTVVVESEEGVGTCFRVTLPLPRSEQPRVEAGLDALVGLRALVVDGNAVTRTVLAHTLHTWGFVVDQAATAEDALELYARTRGSYALAILEFQLEGMDGVKLGEVLRAQDPTASTVMLLLSSDPNVSRRAAHDAGIRSVLVKPVRNTYLLRRIVDTIVTDPTPTPDPAPPPAAPASPVLTS